ncbi:hypothetical protein H5V45_02565 [Nocardioides sp. KIGAM211]|uniref:Uncharacterized protein n=1 Tax=Nocardioides luti TaxID=2761101 RepID=A0A7X0RF60_9ACTN|nr:hypothetical protein [Nocardioides luti]MBB6626195.1 hypothetical protein [Nocardioides luti]
MTGWRAGAVAGVAALVALAGCTPSAEAPAPDSSSPAAAASSSEPAPEPTPAAQHHVVPAVMLSSVIRTPDGPIDTGIAHPATFLQTRTGFVVQDTRGATYAVEGGDVRRIGRSDPAWTRLTADPGGRYVAFAGAGSGDLRVYDSVRHRIVLADRIPTSCDVIACVFLDDHAAYTPSAVPNDYIAQPYRRPMVDQHGTRTVRLLQQHRLSPSGGYVTSFGAQDRLRVRTFDGGDDVTPAIPDGPVRQLVWLAPDSFTVEVETASLISPPDGDVWHLLSCSIPSGTCENALTGVTGTALSIPGTPIRSSPPPS